MQHIGENCAKHRHADRAANRAEQRGAGGRYPHMLWFYAVLRRQDHHLHHHTQPQPQQADVEVQQMHRGRVLQRPQQHHARQGTQGADNRENTVFAALADQPTADDRTEHNPPHQRQQLHPGLGRRGILHYLQIQRQESHRSKQ
ncbi:hypothetical protein D3C73_1145730 [compost metagenome]